MENLGRVLENYGLKKDSGIVMEGDANHYTQLGPNAFLPEISTESAYASSLSADAYVLVQNAQAIREIESYRDSLEIQPILSTTESGYIKQVEDGRISLTQEEEMKQDLSGWEFLLRRKWKTEKHSWYIFLLLPW